MSEEDKRMNEKETIELKHEPSSDVDCIYKCPCGANDEHISGLRDGVCGRNHEMKLTQAALLAAQARIEVLEEKNSKFMWQVRDTCIRAEKAEAELQKPLAPHDPNSPRRLRLLADWLDIKHPEYDNREVQIFLYDLASAMEAL